MGKLCSNKNYQTSDIYNKMDSLKRKNKKHLCYAPFTVSWGFVVSVQETERRWMKYSNLRKRTSGNIE
jgi:hypothetical protein